MKRYRPLIAALFLAGAWTACQQDDELPAQQRYENDPQAVHISVAIEAAQTRVNTAGDGSQWNDDDQIKVTNTSPGAVSGKKEAIYTYSSTGSAWALMGEGYMVWADGENQFEAFYPYSADRDNSFTTFTLPADQSSADPAVATYIGKADWMLATAASSKVDNLPLTFQHQLAKVVVTIKGYNDQYGTTLPTVSAPQFFLPTTRATIEGKTLALENNATSVAGLMTASTANDGLHTFTAILLPGTYRASDDFLRLTVGSETLTVKAANSTLTGTGLESGNVYRFALTVGKNRLAIASVSVNPWAEDEKTHGGTALDGPSIDAATRTITTTEAGQIAGNPDLIEAAIGTGTSLAITGPMDSNDVTAIATYLKSLSGGTKIDLDLSDAELTSVPDLTFGSYFDDEAAQSLGQVNLPTTITEIGGNAFRNCSSFTIANWDELTSLTTIGQYAFMTSGLSGDIILPESITTIERQAFSETYITSIVFPSSITTIGRQMFYRCYSLKKVAFKGDVKSLDGLVFGASSALEEIDLSACTTVPTYPENENPFADISSTNLSKITLKVRSDLVESFKNDENWGKCNVTAAE